MSIENLIPDDASVEKADIVAEAFYEIADAIMATYGFALRELWRKREQLRKPDPIASFE